MEPETAPKLNLTNWKDLKRTLKSPAEFTQTLSSNLTSLQPKSETAQLITYALLATAVVGIMVYHYIRERERTDTFSKGLEKY